VRYIFIYIFLLYIFIYFIFKIFKKLLLFYQFSKKIPDLVNPV